MRDPLRCLILEDEWPARNYLAQLVEQSGVGHVVAAVPTTELANLALANTPIPIDVAFVDVHLVGEHDASRAGIGWIESLDAFAREIGRDPPRVVITTASSEHGMRAFELGAVDYLLKPFTESRVRTTLDRLIATRSGSTPPPRDSEARIAARQGKSIVFLGQNEAYAFEAEGRLAYVHSSRGRLDVDLSLTSLETVLGGGYVRVHRNWLVALGHVHSFARDGAESSLLVGGPEHPLRVPVARDRVGAVRDRLLASSIGLRREG